jgi:hypothetical protein
VSYPGILAKMTDSIFKMSKYVDPLSTAIGSKIVREGSIPPPSTPEQYGDYPDPLEAGGGSGSSELERMLEEKVPGWKSLPLSVQAQIREMVLKQGILPTSPLSSQPSTAASGVDKIFMPSSFRAGGRVGLI